MPNQSRGDGGRNGSPRPEFEPIEIDLDEASQLIESVGVTELIPISNLKSALELALRHSEVWLDVDGKLHIPLRSFLGREAMALFVFVFRRDEGDSGIWTLIDIKRIDRREG